ncbi:CST complex subunit CTC1 [Maylandia zebra]|uniref:CST complex subunit CTC1 n=1 Tax=Maylandia zebra TaxID=106582 RepID=UPI00403C1F5D
METHLRHKGEEPGGDVTARKQTVEEEEETAGSKRRRREEEEEANSGNPWPCVSMVIRVEQKEGVSWRNTGAEAEDQEAGLRLCFSVKAAVIGPVVSWRRDPKNEPMTEKESEQKQERKVVLVFSGVCTRWFPVLQPGCFYRLIAANTQDPSVLIGCGVSERSGVDLHAESTLQVRRGWRFHTLTRPLLLPTCRQAVPPTVLSVSGVLDCSSELVCFQGVVSERISVNNRTAHSGHTHSGVRLTLCDQAGRSLQVYLDLSHTPYPPGLLPGNTLLLSGFQRRLSRTGSV